MLVACLLLFAGQPDVVQDTVRLAEESDERALSLMRVGRQGEAARQFERSIKIWEQLSANHNVDLAGPHFNLAFAYFALGKIAAAEREARVARNLVTKNTPPAHVRRVASFIAQLHFHRREYAEAEGELRAVLSETTGLERSTVLNDLGIVRAAVDDLEGARQALESAVAERLKLQPAGSAELGQFLASLALVRYKQGDIEAAVSLFRLAIPLLEGLPLGPVRVRLGMALAEFSKALRRSGRKAEAKAFHERARAVFQENPDLSIHTVDLMNLR
jgi:tetratricopeptide (TPR) repeat protein